jgi:CubicO group peptidase (beta-lactamase class C family)
VKRAAFFLLTAAISGAAGDYFPPPDSRGGWRSLTSASDKELLRKAGMDRAKLDAAFEFAKDTTQHGGLVVVRHGWLAYERYFGKAGRNANPDMASCGKAFTSIAVGIALKEKRDLIPQGLDTKVFTDRYLPEAFPLDDPAKADISLGQLLSMSAGFHGESTQPGYKNNVRIPLDRYQQERASMDMMAIRTPLWCKPGEGYSYSSPSPHIASIVLRKLTGMELEDYLRVKLGTPMQWESWTYCMYRNGRRLEHTPGAGSIALHATDAMRFGYLLLHNGNWNGKELVPADYVAMCSRPSVYNPHYPYSLMFEVNQDAHVEKGPKDAYWKSGAGGFAIYVVPSLDLVIYKLGGSDAAYAGALTQLPQPKETDASRADWKASSSIPGAGVPGILEMVSAAVTDPKR